MTKQNTQPMSARILRHIADLHEAGIIANNHAVAMAEYKWSESLRGVDKAALVIARISCDIAETLSYNSGDLNSAIAKNERRLAWMEAHPDPTKTPLELWEEAKRAEKDGVTEHE